MGGSVAPALRRPTQTKDLPPKSKTCFLFNSGGPGRTSAVHLSILVGTVITPLFACHLYLPLQREPSLRLPTALSVSRLLRWPCRVAVPAAVAAVGGARLGARGGQRKHGKSGAGFTRGALQPVARPRILASARVRPTRKRSRGCAEPPPLRCSFTCTAQ